MVDHKFLDLFAGVGLLRATLNVANDLLERRELVDSVIIHGVTLSRKLA